VKTPDGYLSSSKEVSRVNRIFNFLFSLRREEGQTMAEYGVVLAVITVALVTIFAALSTEIGNAIKDVTNALK
jgi:Flp pilus assembly pilin Flp